jgi:hypothetical protein
VQLRLSVIGGGKATFKRPGPRSLPLSQLNRDVAYEVFFGTDRIPPPGVMRNVANFSRWSVHDLSELISTGLFSNEALAARASPLSRSAANAARNALFNSPSTLANVSFAATNEVNIFYADLWAFQLAGDLPGASASRGVPTTDGLGWRLLRQGLSLPLSSFLSASTPKSLLATATLVTWTFTGSPVSTIWGPGKDVHRFAIDSSGVSLSLPAGSLRPGYVYCIDADASLTVSWSYDPSLWPLKQPSSTPSASTSPSVTPLQTAAAADAAARRAESAQNRTMLETRLNDWSDARLLYGSDVATVTAIGAYGPMIFIHAPPTKGQSSVSPDSGFRFTDTFTLSTGDWVDVDSNALLPAMPSLAVINTWLRTIIPVPLSLTNSSITGDFRAVFAKECSNIMSLDAASLAPPAWAIVLKMMFSTGSGFSTTSSILSSACADVDAAVSAMVTSLGTPLRLYPPAARLQFFVRSENIFRLVSMGISRQSSATADALPLAVAASLQSSSNLTTGSEESILLSRRMSVDISARIIFSEAASEVAVVTYVIDDIGAANIVVNIVRVQDIAPSFLSGSAGLAKITTFVQNINDGFTGLTSNPMVSVQLLTYASMVINNTLASGSTLKASDRSNLISSVNDMASAIVNSFAAQAIISGRTDVVPPLNSLPVTLARAEITREKDLQPFRSDASLDDSTITQLSSLTSSVLNSASVMASYSEAKYTEIFTRSMLASLSMNILLGTSSSSFDTPFPEAASNNIFRSLSNIASSNQSTSSIFLPTFLKIAKDLGQTMTRSSDPGGPPVTKTFSPSSCDAGPGISVTAQRLAPSAADVQLFFSTPIDCRASSPQLQVSTSALFENTKLRDFKIVFIQWTPAQAPSTMLMRSFFFEASTPLIGLSDYEPPEAVNSIDAVDEEEPESSEILLRRELAGRVPHRRSLASIAAAEKTIDVYEAALSKRESVNKAVQIRDYVPGRPLSSRLVTVSLFPSAATPVNEIAVLNTSFTVTVPMVNNTKSASFHNGEYDLGIGYQQYNPLRMMVRCPLQNSPAAIGRTTSIRYAPDFEVPLGAAAVPLATITSDDIIEFSAERLTFLTSTSTLSSPLFRRVLNWKLLQNSNMSAGLIYTKDIVETTARLFTIEVDCGPSHASPVTFACGPGFSGIEIPFRCPAIRPSPRCLSFNRTSATGEWSQKTCTTTQKGSTNDSITCSCSTFGDIAAHLVALPYFSDPDLFVRTTPVKEFGSTQRGIALLWVCGVLVLFAVTYLFAAMADETAAIKFAASLENDEEISFLAKYDEFRVRNARKSLAAANDAFNAAKKSTSILAVKKREMAAKKMALEAARAAVKNLPSAPSIVDRRPIDNALATFLRNVIAKKSKVKAKADAGKIRMQLGDNEALGAIKRVEDSLEKRFVGAAVVADALSHSGAAVVVESSILTDRTHEHAALRKQRDKQNEDHLDEEEHNDLAHGYVEDHEMITRNGALTWKLLCARVRGQVRLSSIFAEISKGFYLAAGRTTALALIAASVSYHGIIVVQLSATALIVYENDSWLTWVRIVFIVALISAFASVALNFATRRFAWLVEAQAFKWRYPNVYGELKRRKEFERALSGVPTSEILARLKIGSLLDDEATVSAKSEDAEAAFAERSRASKRKSATVGVAPSDGMDEDGLYDAAATAPTEAKTGTPNWELAARRALAEVDKEVVQLLAAPRAFDLEQCSMHCSKRRSVVRGFPFGSTSGVFLLYTIVAALLTVCFGLTYMYFLMRSGRGLSALVASLFIALFITHGLLTPAATAFASLWSDALYPPDRGFSTKGEDVDGPEDIEASSMKRAVGATTERMEAVTFLHAVSAASDLPPLLVFCSKTNPLKALSAATREDHADARGSLLLQFYAVLRLGGWRAAHDAVQPGGLEAPRKSTPKKEDSTGIIEDREGLEEEAGASEMRETQLLGAARVLPSPSSQPSRTLTARSIPLNTHLGDHSFSLASSRTVSPAYRPVSDPKTLAIVKDMWAQRSHAFSSRVVAAGAQSLAPSSVATSPAYSPAPSRQNGLNFAPSRYK